MQTRWMTVEWMDLNADHMKLSKGPVINVGEGGGGYITVRGQVKFYPYKMRVGVGAGGWG